MVAYSYKPYFAPQISTGIKCQTVRADRRRHARPGERIQHFVGMRTRRCHKVRPDTICVSIEPIRIDLFDEGILCIVVGERVLTDDEMESFARDDGFAPEHINGICIDMSGKTALENMSRFWLDNHFPGPFYGVLVKWRPA